MKDCQTVVVHIWVFGRCFHENKLKEPATSRKIVRPWPMWPSWLEHYLVNGKIVGSILSQGTYMFRLHVRIYEKQPICVSLSHRSFSPFLTPSLLLSLKINEHVFC